MSILGRPRFTDKGHARLCLVAAVGQPPMICALGPDSDGDLRAVFALAMGLRIDQVRLAELTPGWIYAIDKLLPGWIDDLPVLISMNPECWSDEKKEAPP